MSKLVPAIDPEGLLEYSVVFTDRSLNHMSQTFQQVMRDVSTTLKDVYNANAVAVVPGGGTFGMEAVARQFAQDKKCLVIRNGWFSYRWSQIFEMGRIPASETVLKFCAHCGASGALKICARCDGPRYCNRGARQLPDYVFVSCHVTRAHPSTHPPSHSPTRPKRHAATGVECQRQHWRAVHKAECREEDAAEARAAAAD